MRELPDFRWGSVFRTLRLMKLSGELLAGYFFKGIPGPQFISHQAFHTLKRGMAEKAIFWLKCMAPEGIASLRFGDCRTWITAAIGGWS